MTTPTDIVREFYARLGDGDPASALGLMAPDIEWNTMWHYKVDGLGPEKVAEGLFKPLMAEWTIFALVAKQFVAEGNTVVLPSAAPRAHTAPQASWSTPTTPTSGGSVAAASSASISTSTRSRSRRHGFKARAGP